MSCTETTTAAASPTRRVIPPPPLRADVLKKVLLKLSNDVNTDTKPSFNLPQKVLNLVLDFVPSSDLAPLLTVNSTYYRATKPQFFRELNLTKDGKVRGWGYDLVDTWTKDRSRPIFKVEWLSRVTTVLSIEAHSSGSCDWLSQLDLPLLHTVRLPNDVHRSIANKTCLTPCGIHALKADHVVHTDLSWHPTLGTTTNFANGTVQTYTAFLADNGIRRERRWTDPMATAFTSTVKITYVFPVVPFPRREPQAPVAPRKSSNLDNNGYCGDHDSPRGTEKPIVECQPLAVTPKGMSYSMETYRELTDDCDHNGNCIHIHFLNCIWSMNDAYWCHILTSKATFVFVGLDELVSSILVDRQHTKRAASHLAFLAKVQAAEFLELVNSLHQVCPDVDPKEVAQFDAAFKKYLSSDVRAPFLLMRHEHWQLSSGAKIAMLRKDREKWQHALARQF
ncbi:hypothetical protein CspHIS471_0301050 [Cutaneotrichosporon sp. HIS471]|nr:hypothetical protein CspHIS471_0301050 [Cutaneotrichosporon sp. HIS471]